MNSALPRVCTLLATTSLLAAAPSDAQVRSRARVREVTRPPVTTAKPAPTTAKPTTTTSTTAPRRARYRVVLAGGRVNHPTYDNPLNLDGWGDEIFVTADVQLLDKASGNISPFTALS